MAFITSYSSLLAVSQDSVVVHERFADLNPGFGGVFGIKFPLMEDKDGNISRLYGVDKAQAGHSFRAYFIIDPSQVLKYSLSQCASLPIGRLCVLGWWAICQWHLGWRR